MSFGGITQGPTQTLAWGSSQTSRGAGPGKRPCHCCLTYAEVVGSPEGMGARYPDCTVREDFLEEVTPELRMENEQEPGR